MEALSREKVSILIPSSASRFFPSIKQFLVEKGFAISIADRELFWKSDAFDFFLIRGTDIPNAIAQGWADVGITGLDVVAEHDARVLVLAKLGIRYSEVILASNKITTLQALAPMALIATEYPRLSHAYFNQKRLLVSLYAITGAAEGFGQLPNVAAIVTLKTSGATLAANSYTILDVIFTTQACLIANHTAIKQKYQGILALQRSLTE